MPDILSDYGRLHVGARGHDRVRPETPEAAREAVAAALAEGRPLRWRGSGHGISGASLPREGECLVLTHGLDHYRWDAWGTITVGAGALLWDVRDLVAERGWQMPVYNGGWAGPTVGGYVAAGGMGLRVPPTEREKALAARSSDPGGAGVQMISASEVHGGFWEHVAEIALVDGTGTLRRIREDDPAFRWIFAAQGQLGLVVEVTLKLLPAIAEGEPPYPLGETGRVPRRQADDPAINDAPSPAGGQPWIFWFSYLVPEAREAEAWETIGPWVAAHAGTVSPRAGWVGPRHEGEPVGYRYVVRHRRFHPPLLYPREENFVLMGVMAAVADIGRIETDEALAAAERAFADTALARGWQLYAQAENATRGLDWAAYYGPEIFARFRALKDAFDPGHRICRGEVFPAPGAPGPHRLSTLRRFARSLGLGGG